MRDPHVRIANLCSFKMTQVIRHPYQTNYYKYPRQSWKPMVNGLFLLLRQNYGIRYQTWFDKCSSLESFKTEITTFLFEQRFDWTLKSLHLILNWTLKLNLSYYFTHLALLFYISILYEIFLDYCFIIL